MMTDESPERDRLAIPDTRPNMTLFIPNELAIMLFAGTVGVSIQTHSIVSGIIIFPLWLAAALLVRRDMNGVRVFMIRMRLAGLLLDAHRWGGLSTSPWPLKEKRRA